MMLRAFKEKGGVWIMKPVSGRQGKGIFLVNKPSQIDSWLKQSAKEKEVEDQKTVSYVAQKYIHNPYLVVMPPPQPAQQRCSRSQLTICLVRRALNPRRPSVSGCGWVQGGKKFDLRIFALVLSYAPLKVYLYREGFARFTNTTYSLDKDDLSNSSVHLTNHAVQKKDADYDATKSDLKWCVPLGGFAPLPHPFASLATCRSRGWACETVWLTRANQVVTGAWGWRGPGVQVDSLATHILGVYAWHRGNQRVVREDPTHHHTEPEERAERAHQRQALRGAVRLRRHDRSGPQAVADRSERVAGVVIGQRARL